MSEINILSIIFIIAVATAVSSIYVYIYPAIKYAEDNGIVNTFTENKYLMLMTFFIMFMVVFIPLIIVYFIPKLSSRFQDALFNEIIKSD